MKILYDHQMFTFQEYGGISRYFTELMNHFHKDREVSFSLSLLLSNNHYLHKRPFGHYLPFFKGKNFRGQIRLMNSVNTYLTKKTIAKGNFDIFHPTYYDPYFLDVLGEKPFVLTVYDLIHEKFPELFASHDSTAAHKKLLATKANHIIAISQSTKNDLMKLLNIPDDKITVVHLGSSLTPSSPAKKITIELPDRYILFVGSRTGYKNFTRFVEAAAKALHEDADLHLVCAGGGLFNPQEISLFEVLGINGRVLQKTVDDDTLCTLYRHALFFVFPSLYEGFGLPILEAFACGCPLLCSNTSSFPEIAGNGALYFDPSNTESIESAIMQALRSDELRSTMQKTGAQRLALFSWEKCAEETKKVYKTLL